MKYRALCLITFLPSLCLSAHAQTGALTNSGGELPLLTVIGAGIIGGGIWSAMKTRHQK